MSSQVHYLDGLKIGIDGFLFLLMLKATFKGDYFTSWQDICMWTAWDRMCRSKCYDTCGHFYYSTCTVECSPCSGAYNSFAKANVVI